IWNNLFGKSYYFFRTTICNRKWKCLSREFFYDIRNGFAISATELINTLKRIANRNNSTIYFDGGINHSYLRRIKILCFVNKDDIVFTNIKTIYEWKPYHIVKVYNHLL